MLINLERARLLMKEAELDALVLATPTNVTYAAGFASEFMLGRFEDFTAAVILPRSADAAPVLVVPEFDLPYLAQNPSWIDEIQVYGSPWSSVGIFMGETLAASLGNELRRKLNHLRETLRPQQAESFLAAIERALTKQGLARARLATDEMRLAPRLAARTLGDGEIGDAVQLMRRIRLVKTDAELEIMTQGAAINAAALRAVIEAGRVGMGEAELIRTYRRALTEHDARWLGERGMMFGVGDASSFALPASDDRRLTPGEAIVLDCLGTFRSYYMDLARTGVIGAPTAAQQLRYRAAVAALEAVEEKIRPGVDTQDLRRLVRSTISGFGLRGELTSVTTHGLGLEVFEFPYENSLAEGFTLEAGMVVNTEVFYRDPELGSFHLEDSVRVTEAGCELLHPVPRELVIFQ